MKKKTIHFYWLGLGSLLLFTVLNCGKKQENKPSKTTTVYLSDKALLDTVEKQTFKYFWDFAEPVSGLARERYHPNGVYPENDAHIITTGGSGFGLMAIIAGVSRGYITKEEAVERFDKIADFLAKADRFHGAWSHWIDGVTGKTKPFGTKDNGADLVETAFLTTGIITVREYLKDGSDKEKAVAAKYDALWKGVEWDWFTHQKDVLYWHWSPNYHWEMDFPLEGYNECLIAYILASASPTHSIRPEAYHKGWARNGKMVISNTKYDLPLILNHNEAEEFGGPLFWAHYSFVGLDPTQLTDQYANYWDLNYNHSKINQLYCIENPKNFKGYGADYWGLSASYTRNEDDTTGYTAHFPDKNDHGVISPTAAISSIVYTPKESLAVMRNLYENYHDQIWGEAGFYDAHSIEHKWSAKRYLAIDQGPQVIMIENYRSGLLWKLFMNAPEVKQGLLKLGFHSGKYKF